MNDSLKALIPATCPHCSKEVVFSFKITTPEVLATYTPADLQKAKNDVILKVEGLELPSEVKKDFLSWVTSPETNFGPGDVDEIIKNLLNDSAKKPQA